MRDTAPPKQLALDLPLDPRYGREDFLVGPANEAAYALVEAWPDWPDTVLVLTGPPGSGKSHLAAIWAGHAHAWTVPASAVTGGSVTHLVSNGALVVEDIDRPEGRDEAALFHLLNLVRERRGFLLLSADRGVSPHWPRLPDLASRLRAIPRIELQSPEEPLVRAVLVKLLHDRQLVVDAALVEYIVRRIDRSLATAQDLVSELDREALAQGRRVTRALAGEVLARLVPDEP